MVIRTKRELSFVIKADRMMNIGRFDIPITERVRILFSPNLILSFLERMRKCSYYGYRSHGGGQICFLYSDPVFLQLFEVQKTWR